MQSKASTVAEYLAALPPDRAGALAAVRQTILDNLDDGIEEGISYGMIGYFIPHRIYPKGYHCDPRQPLPFAGFASQKNYMSLYLSCLYPDTSNDTWFRTRWAQTGLKLDMGKACIRFQSLDQIPLTLIGETIARFTVANYIKVYENSLDRLKRTKPATPSNPTSKKPTPKPTPKPAAKKATPSTAKVTPHAAKLSNSPAPPAKQTTVATPTSARQTTQKHPTNPAPKPKTITARKAKPRAAPASRSNKTSSLSKARRRS